MRSVEDAPVIKLTNYILRQSVEESASDVLIEPLGKNARVRFRIDGILREMQTFSKKMLDFVISRIKVIANLNITEHRLPQDGRFRMSVLGPRDRLSCFGDTLTNIAVKRSPARFRQIRD